MAEIVLELARDTRAKAVRALGFGRYDPSNLIKRENYKTEAEYLIAKSDFEARMSDPNFRASVLGVVQREVDEREEAAAAKALEEQATRYQEIRKGVSLQEYEREEIDRRARDAARADFAAGRISSGMIARKAADYCKEFEEQALDQKASNIQINEMFRADAKSGTFTDEDIKE